MTIQKQRFGGDLSTGDLQAVNDEAFCEAATVLLDGGGGTAVPDLAQGWIEDNRAQVDEWIAAGMAAARSMTHHE